MLRSSSRLRDDADFETFDRAVALLAESLDPRDLPAIYRAFDDGTEDYEVYWSLVHLVDKYDWRLMTTTCFLRRCRRLAIGWNSSPSVR